MLLLSDGRIGMGGGDVASVSSGEQSLESNSKISIFLSVYVPTLSCGPEV